MKPSAPALTETHILSRGHPGFGWQPMIPVFGAGPVTEGERDFYAALGWAMTQWQDVEYALALISDALAGGPQASGGREPARRPIGFETRLDAVDAAAQAALEGRRLETWNRLYKKLSDQASVRDELLHFSVIHTDPGRSRDGYPMHLQPGLERAAPAGRHGGDAPTYNTRQIMEKGRAFARLGDELLDFAKELGATIGR